MENELLSKLVDDTAQIKEALLGNPTYKSKGLIQRMDEVECKVEKFIDWKVWILGAFAGITALGGLVFTIITILS